jgi:hypothetical protein
MGNTKGVEPEVYSLRTAEGSRVFFAVHGFETEEKGEEAGQDFR